MTFNIAIIPARAGSKSIRDKNLQSIAGKPLLAHSIEHALAAEFVDRVIVDTDSPHYAELAREYGAEVPYLRPPELATDTSTDFDVFYHALTWLREHEAALPTIIIHLRPTYPHRTPDDIDAAIELMNLHPHWDSLRSVALAPHTPYKMWNIKSDGTLKPLLDSPQIKEPWSQPRQILPLVYHQNACIDLVRPRTVLEMQSMSGECIGAFVMDHFYDIDTRVELERAATSMATQRIPSDKTFVFDIDGVVATLTPGNDYRFAEPMTEHIKAINILFDHGNRIIFMTARGSSTGIDWRKLTEAQLARWGVRYHELLFGKPAADYYIDDRMLPLSSITTWLCE